MKINHFSVKKTLIVASGEVRDKGFISRIKPRITFA
jgi:hypothetical protein